MLLEDKRFYVYIYLDPSKNGKFIYDKYEFKYEPFYVGKGMKDQYLSHMKEINNLNRKTYKVNKIRKIVSNNDIPIIIKVEENLTENQAFDLEKKLISSIGRACLNQGPLTNIAEGGTGGAMPPHIRKIISSKLKGIPMKDEVKQLISLRNKGKNTRPRTDIEKQNLSQKLSFKWKTDSEFRIKMTQINKDKAKRGTEHHMYGKSPSQDTRDKISKSNKGKTNSLKQLESAKKLMTYRNPRYKEISLEEIKNSLFSTNTYEECAKKLNMTKQGLMYKLDKMINKKKYKEVKEYFKEN